jgi:hypothetical protein
MNTMAIFREGDSGGWDRSAEDRRRHRQLVEESIKKNLGNIIADESIIGQSKGKVYKVPIRGLKEYQFIYGENRPGVVTGNGSEKRGQKIPRPLNKQESGSMDGAGNIDGDEMYETEITLEELVNYLFEDLSLPHMERKKFSLLETERSSKRWGIQRKGTPPRLAKKRSMAERIKRRKASQRWEDENEKETVDDRFPFSETDLRYQRLKEELRPQSNAAVICIMDNSGSMYLSKKYMARSFFFLLYQFVRYRYVNVELVFINHTTKAKEVNEDEFFHRGESGGTIISSGYEKALEIITERFDPEIWNIYAFHCSDGDNWPEDVEKAIQKARELTALCNLFGYGEIVSTLSTTGETMFGEYKKAIKARNFVAVLMSSKDDIWPAFKQLLGAAGETSAP